MKVYLSKMRTLEQKYKELYEELEKEEDASIYLTAKKVFTSPKFCKMSLNSKANFLAAEIVNVREEYRSIVRLLKEQESVENQEAASGAIFQCVEMMP